MSNASACCAQRPERVRPHPTHRQSAHTTPRAHKCTRTNICTHTHTHTYTLAHSKRTRILIPGYPSTGNIQNPFKICIREESCSHPQPGYIQQTEMRDAVTCCGAYLKTQVASGMLKTVVLVQRQEDEDCPNPFITARVERCDDDKATDSGYQIVWTL